MMRIPPGNDEEKRVAALRAYKILDTEPEATFDRLVRIARTLLDVPVAKITMVDRDRAWTKAVVSEKRKEKPRWLTFCNATVAMDRPPVVEDAVSDERFRENPSSGPRTTDSMPGSWSGVETVIRSAPYAAALTAHALQMTIKSPPCRTAGSWWSTRWRCASSPRAIRSLVMTRLAFLDTLSRDVALAVRHGRPLSAILVVGFNDLDRLVAIKGHAAGDQVMRRYSGLCRGQLRSSDYVGNMGSNRFALILRETFARDAGVVAHRLRDEEAEVFDAPHGEGRVTVSASLAGLGPRTSKDETLLAATGQALAAAMMDCGCQTVAYERLALRRA